jgi:hypothetical protein
MINFLHVCASCTQILTRAPKSVFSRTSLVKNSDFIQIRVKVKVTMSLFLTTHHNMKTCRRVEVQLHTFLTSALDGSEWLAS